MADWKKTQYAGVRYKENPNRNYHNGRPDRYYLIRYGRNGKTVQEGYGWSSEGITAQHASDDRAEIIKNPGPRVLFLDFGDSALDFELRFWAAELWTTDIILSDLRYAIDREFRNEDIEIPFPQRDLHIKTCEPQFSLAYEQSGS